MINGPCFSEMEFMDISLKNSSADGFGKKTKPYSTVVLKIHTKNPARNKKTRVRKRLESKKTRVYAQKPRLKMPFMNFISRYDSIAFNSVLVF
jgi:hypothetical protein